MTARPLDRAFYDRPCLEVAAGLVGKWLVHRSRGGARSGRIVEVEAYVGQEDQACHARFGPTPRAQVMFGPPGHAYVYLVYGLHECFNVVTEAAGRPAAVLIRALEAEPPLTARTDGPGRLCRALGISREHNGLDLTARIGRTGDRLWLEDRGGPPPRLARTPRIGVEYAGEWAARPWRLVDADSPALSRRLA